LIEFITTNIREVAPLRRLKELEFFVSNISESGEKTFFKSYLFGSFRIILARHTKAFLRTIGIVLLERASSKMASDNVVRDCGIIVANIERARDCEASLRDLISDSTEYMTDFQISSADSGISKLQAMYPVYFSSYLDELINPEAS
jgi:hypothetical protein